MSCPGLAKVLKPRNPPRRRVLRRRAARLGAPHAGAPDSLSAARWATGDFGRPLAPLRPKTSKIRASAQRARFLGVRRVDALAPMIPRKCFEKPAAARAPLVAPRQRLVLPPGRALASSRSNARARVTACRPGTHSQPRRSPLLRASRLVGSRLVGSGPRIHRNLHRYVVGRRRTLGTPARASSTSFFWQPTTPPG